MIQDIYPHKYDNVYKNYKVDDDSQIFIFDGNKVYLEENNGVSKIPTYKFIKERNKFIDDKLTYLFKIDEIKFYLLDYTELEYSESLIEKNIKIFRSMEEEYLRFAGATALHLYKWYSLNKYCGKCGKPTKKDDVERAMVCTCCNNKIYPIISPAIMVGIINEDKLLLTKYARGGINHYTLVAGFVEIGETLEDTVKREVMEEVGLRVKNIKYYKSQPWGFSNTMMIGFFAELDGDDIVELERDELSEAKWFKQSELPVMDSLNSLSEDMITEFKKNGVTKK